MSVAERAKLIYELQLKEQLEAQNLGQFVAIEPDSESFFVAEQFIDAAQAAKNAYPDRKSFVIRIGHDAAFHIGAYRV